MDAADQARIAISNGISTLVARRAASTDPAEKTTINQAISDLNDQMLGLDAEGLQAATEAVAAATDALESCIAAAKVGPFGGFLSTIEITVSQLQTAQSQIFAVGKLPKAAPLSEAPAAPSAAPATAAVAHAGLPAINPSTAFNNLEAEYQAYFAACVLGPAHAADLQFVTGRLAKFRPTYEATGADLGIPWHFIGLLHAMESGFNFGTHLHNGDPLTARTVHEPAGRPPSGSPPFAWQASARDALIFQQFDHQADWSVPRILYRLEQYNGFGYRFRRLPSPYLWSFSNLYTAGKFIADGVFDPNAVSQQCGAGAALRALHLADLP